MVPRKNSFYSTKPVTTAVITWRIVL